MDKNKPNQKSLLDRISKTFNQGPQNRIDLLELLRDSAQRGLIDRYALSMSEGVLRVSEMQVRDIMVPRKQMVSLFHDMTLKAALPVVVESAHSRFPVIAENQDQVYGLLMAKDLLRIIHKESMKDITIDALLRPPVFIPETQRLDIFLRECRTKRNHMAIVVNEYGGISGLVTIEDVLEQIVGDIEDEHDYLHDPINIRKLSDMQFTLKAITPLEEFNKYFKTDHDQHDVDTIGGLILKTLGYVPKRGETIELGSFKITIMAATDRTIQLLRLDFDQK